MANNLGERIRQARKDAGLAQEAVARRADVGVNVISRLERGSIQDPHYSTLSGIAHALGMSVAELVSEEEPALVVGKARAPQDSGHQRIQVALGEEDEEVLSPFIADINREFDAIVATLRAAGVGEEIIAEYAENGVRRRHALEAVRT